MYHQIQSRPTVWLWWNVPKAIRIDTARSSFSLSSLVVVLPLTRTVTEDSAPAGTISLISVNVGGPINQSVTDNNQGTLSLVSVVNVIPINRTVTEDSSPAGNFSLVSVVKILPVQRSISETAAGSFSLVSNS